MDEKSVETLMSRKVVSVEPECPIADLLNKMHAYRISCVLVCEEGNRPVGIISERDAVGVAYNLASGRGESRETARQLMSNSLTTVKSSDLFDDAVRVAIEQRIRHLPVVDGDGRLVGLLTQSDLLRGSLGPS